MNLRGPFRRLVAAAVVLAGMSPAALTSEAEAEAVTTIDVPTASRVDPRLVQAPYGQFDTKVTSRVLPDGDWTDVVLPQGYTLVDYTADGILATSFASGLSLLPWSGGAPIEITGVPSGFVAAYYESARAVVHGGSAAVLRVNARDGSGAYHQVLVDTAQRRAWALPETGACDARRAGGWGIGSDALVWRSGAASLLCTLSRQPTARRCRGWTPRTADHRDLVEVLRTSGSANRAVEPVRLFTA